MLCFLYEYGVSPNRFLKSAMKCEQSENPELIQASVTDEPFTSILVAFESLTDSRYSRGEECIYFLNHLVSVAELIKCVVSISLTFLIEAKFLFTSSIIR